MRALLCGLVLVAAAVSYAQAPISDRAAYGVIHQVETSLSASLGIKKPDTVKRKFDGKFERSELIREMDRIFKRSQAGFVLTPRMVKVDHARIGKANSKEDSRILANLIKWGVVAPVGPVAVGPESTLTPRQLGNALGHFSARIAQLATRPRPDYTPSLMGGG